MFNIILPTYNERENIIICINILEDVFKIVNYKSLIIIVDDNSPDKTSEAVEALEKDNIVLIKRSGKLGLGSAYQAALPKCKYPYTIILDCDLQHNPFDIIRMIKYIKFNEDMKSELNIDYDIITGTRYGRNNTEIGKVANLTFFRRFTSTFAANIANFVLDAKPTDLTGSFRIYKTSVLKELSKKIICVGFGFQVEIILRAQYAKYLIKEVPITFYDRRFGKSKFKTIEIFRYLIMIFILYFVL